MTFETIQVELIYNGKEVTIECDIKEKIKNIFKKFLIFYYYYYKYNL